MLLRRLATKTRPLPRTLKPSISSLIANRQPQRRLLSQENELDPNMNGGYENPPRIIRQHRDPYADWWDKQDRRNFGEPVHEDNDVLGVFSPEDYNFYTPVQSFALIGCFIASFLTVIGVVSLYYPDKVAVDRGFEGGLDRELGGEGALLARSEDGID